MPGLPLTRNRLDLGLLEQLLGAVDVEVGDTDRLGEALLDELRGSAHIRRGLDVAFRARTRPVQRARATHSLKSTPGGGHIVRERDVKLDLAVVGLDDVVPAWELAGGDVDLEVDLGWVSAFLKLAAAIPRPRGSEDRAYKREPWRASWLVTRLTFQCIRYKSR
jgi:hypothetical protein